MPPVGPAVILGSFSQHWFVVSMPMHDWQRSRTQTNPRRHEEARAWKECSRAPTASPLLCKLLSAGQGASSIYQAWLVEHAWRTLKGEPFLGRGSMLGPQKNSSKHPGVWDPWLFFGILGSWHLRSLALKEL